MHHTKRHNEKIQMKKQLKAHDERNVKQKDDGAVQEGALPTYLLDREGQKVRPASLLWHRLILTLAGRQSPVFRHQGPQKRPCRQVCCTVAKGPGYRGRG